MAVVVSYNGLTDLKQTVIALERKVGHICIVDNCSDRESKLVLYEISKNDGITLLELDNNKGIGYALNVGVEYAMSLNFKWVLTMDQDSIIDEHAIGNYCEAIEKHPDIVCLCPTLNVFGKNLAINSSKSNAPIREVKYAITSGNLFRLDVFSTVDKFDELLFIDCVDFDFSLRLRKAGFKIYQVANSVIYHQLGEKHDVPRIFSWFYTSHSPIRRYYMFRNWGYIVKKFISSFPIFIMKSSLVHFLLLCIIPFYDKSPRKSVRYILYGIIDFSLGRKGAFKRNI